MPEIVKVQKPLFSLDQAWLVYDASRKRLQMLPHKQIDSKVRKIMKGKIKDYLWAEWCPIQRVWTLLPKFAPQGDF